MLREFIAIRTNYYFVFSVAILSPVVSPDKVDNGQDVIFRTIANPLLEDLSEVVLAE